MSTTLTRTDLAESLSDANSVLLLTPSMSGDGDAACIDLLQPEDPSLENMLWVSYTKSPDEQLRRWRSNVDQQPANLGLVSVEESTRSVSAAAGGGGESSLPENGPVETVSNPNDLTGLGISVTEFLTRWDENDYRTTVCFDSLTAMLQYVELETAYKFLHVLTGRLAALDAFAHFHMDPGAHDDQTVESIVSLMDAVVEIDEDGPELRTRKNV